MAPERQRLVAAVLAAAVVLTGVGVVAARPPPQPVCQVCTDDVLSPGLVDGATVDVRLDRDGTGHWTVRYDLRVSGDSLDAQRLRATAREALDGHRSEPTPRNVSASVGDGTATVTYEIPRMAHRSLGGALVVDYFYDHGDGARWYGVNAEQVALRGPDGMALTHVPVRATATDGAVVWTGAYDDTFAATIAEGSFAVFAPGPGIGGTAATTLGIGIDVAQAKAGGLPGVAALPAAVLAVFVAVLFARGDAISAVSIPRRFLWTGGLTALLAAACVLITPLIADFSRYSGVVEQLHGAFSALAFAAVFVGGPSLLGVGTVAALQYVAVGPRVDLSLGTVVRTSAALAALALAFAPIVAGMDTQIGDLYGVAVGLVVPLLFLPMAATDSPRARALLAAAIVLSPVLLVFGFGPFGGFVTLYIPLLYVPWALVTGFVGTLAYTSGRSRAVD